MSAVLFTLGVIVVLLLANALFVAAEFAIVGVPRTSVERLASHGNALARRVLRILEHAKRRDRYLATTQIGVSLASLGLGMYGEHVIAEWIGNWLEPMTIARFIAAHTVGSIVAVAILTYAHLVVGEMVPKALALQSAERTAMWVSPLIETIEKAILPLVVSLDALRAMVVRAIGIEGEVAEEERYHSTEELQLIIEESKEEGLLRGESGRILSELFEFGDLTAGQVMVPRVRLVSIGVGTTADRLREIVRMRPHTRFPVHTGDPDDILGSVHIKDLLRHIVSNQPITPADARPVPYIPNTMPLDEVLGAMRRTRAQMAVVMDEHGGTAGIVTIEDLFEEVVGDIDEGRGRTPIWREPTGRLLVRGTVRLKDAGDAIGRSLEHPDVQTISGLVLSLLGRPAVVGDVVTWNNVRIEVAAVAGRGVLDAALTYRTPPRSEQ
ncbi:MAG TPA: hemolysin family protein [Vicinamibacterales bacterium]|nr:hemolysin family protein [Vicinamibacterales bacterium]